MIVLAVALVFNVPAVLQRAIPDYTERAAGQGRRVRRAVQREAQPRRPRQRPERASCRTAPTARPSSKAAAPHPTSRASTAWLNTPGGAPIDLKSLRGKVVLIDFWAYSCINCQRAIPHVVDWYGAYQDEGLEVIGVHSPEYAFEKVQANVASGADGSRHHLPGRARQQPVDLDQLPQPLLARRVPDRRERAPCATSSSARATTTSPRSLIRQLLSRRRREPAARSRRAGHHAHARRSRPRRTSASARWSTTAATGAYDEGTADVPYPKRLADDSFACAARGLGLPGRHREPTTTTPSR